MLPGPPGTLAAGSLPEVTDDWGFRLGRSLTRASPVTAGAYHQLRRPALRRWPATLACRASFVPLPLTHPDEHPWVSGCTALPTHPRSRSSSWQEAIGRSPPFSTLTSPTWFGESRVRGASGFAADMAVLQLVLWVEHSRGNWRHGLPMRPWLLLVVSSCRVVSVRITPGLEFPQGFEGPRAWGLEVVWLQCCFCCTVL